MKEWELLAACRDHPNPDLWFPERGDHVSPQQALRICADCPVREQCRDFALETDQVDGIWGHLTSMQRTKLIGRPAHRRRRSSADPVTDLQPCGTAAAYARHLRRSETPCRPCKDANAQLQRAKAARRRACMGDGDDHRPPRSQHRPPAGGLTMPREYAKNWTTMWTDEDFCNQPIFDKLLWNVLLGQPATMLNNAGVQPLAFKRWRNAMRDGDRIPTELEIKAALVRMERRRYVYSDEDTGELLIRTFMRGDQVAKQPTLLVSALRAAALVESPKLAKVLLGELTGRIDLPDIAGGSAKAEGLRKSLAAAHLKAITHLEARSANAAEPLPEPFTEDLEQGMSHPSSLPMSQGMSQGMSEPSSQGSAHPSPRPAEIHPSSQGSRQGMSLPSRRGSVVVEVEVESPPVDGDLGGSRARTRDDDHPAEHHTQPSDPDPTPTPSRPEPPRRCRAHRTQPDDAVIEENCGPCANFRRAHDNWTAEQTTELANAHRTHRAHQAAQRAQAITRCELCDDDGYLPNRTLCAHDPTQAATNARGIAAVRAAMTKPAQTHA